MSEVVGRCPKCGKALKVPAELSGFVCMYCAAPLKQEELLPELVTEESTAIAELREKLRSVDKTNLQAADELIGEIWDLDVMDPEANEAYVRLHFGEILFDHEDAMKYFSRHDYVSYFQRYLSSSRMLMEACDRMAGGNSEAGIEKLCSVCQKLVADIDARVEKDESLKGKHEKAGFKEDLKVILAVYAIPMIREQKLGVSEVLADILIESWIEANPKSIIKKGSYEQIRVGFKKGKLCFITTAVCEYLGKPDDCEELTAFRAFRDSYMLETEERRALVKEYYEYAPAIVSCIDLCHDRDRVYEEIRETWLSPCMDAILREEPEKCAGIYTEMVRTLEKRYLSFLQ